MVARLEELAMNSRVTTPNMPYFPLVLRYTNIKSYILTAVFVSLSVAVPWGFHQFHLAGATYLPMHIFVLMAGLAFGWRAGLVTGLLSPLASFAVSGMPVMTILPQVTVEIAAYGLLSGLLAEKFRLEATWSLLGAMAGGRLALLVFLSVSYLLGGQIHSPLGPEAGPLNALWTVIRLGWPGILVQLLSLPLLFWLLNKNNSRSQVR